MPRTSALERPSSLRLMGLGLLAILLFFLWLTWAFFSQAFTDHADVKLVASHSGLSLPERADVKLRGMQVGVVRDVQVENGRVVMTLGMDPALIDRIPANVRAEIIPKTLFGEKYISLIPQPGGSMGHLKAGDTIHNAVVPVEFEKFFNDIYPLLTAVPPEKVSVTLTALADALDGKGKDLGAAFVEANDYLSKLNPDTQKAVSDIVALGTASQTYAGQMDEVGRLLRHSAKISRTIVDKRHDLADFFDETNDLAKVLTSFFAASGEDIVATAQFARRPLQVGAEYAPIYPCFFRGLDWLLDNRLDDVWANGTLHITLFTVAPQPTQYDGAGGEFLTIPTEDEIEAVEDSGSTPFDPGGANSPGPNGLGQVCQDLDNRPTWTHDDPMPIATDLWQLVGIQGTHNGKLDDNPNNRAAPVSLSDVDSPVQRDLINRMTTALTGVKTKDVPDVASMLLGPVVRGAGVSVE